jgi:hypothetical protein
MAHAVKVPKDEFKANIRAPLKTAPMPASGIEGAAHAQPRPRSGQGQRSAANCGPSNSPHMDAFPQPQPNCGAEKSWKNSVTGIIAHSFQNHSPMIQHSFPSLNLTMTSKSLNKLVFNRLWQHIKKLQFSR